eukprot:scaffold46557_cov70-Phaeocystis_antarctica.AAC.6
MQCEEWPLRQGGEDKALLQPGLSGPRDMRLSGQRCQPIVSTPSMKWNCMRTDESPMRTIQRSCSASRSCSRPIGCDAVSCAESESCHVGLLVAQKAHALHLHCTQWALL